MNVMERKKQIFYMIFHIIGVLFSITALVLCVIQSAGAGSGSRILASCLYGAGLILFHIAASIFYGLKLCKGKNVFLVLLHCISVLLPVFGWFPLFLGVLRQEHAACAWSLFGILVGIAVLGITFASINMKRFHSVWGICIGVNAWLPIFCAAFYINDIGRIGFYLLSAGNVLCTLGIVIHSLRGKRIYPVYPLVLAMGGILHFFAVWMYIL